MRHWPNFADCIRGVKLGNINAYGILLRHGNGYIRSGKESVWGRGEGVIKTEVLNRKLCSRQAIA